MAETGEKKLAPLHLVWKRGKRRKWERLEHEFPTVADVARKLQAVRHVIARKREQRERVRYETRLAAAGKGTTSLAGACATVPCRCVVQL